MTTKSEITGSIIGVYMYKIKRGFKVRARIRVRGRQ